MHKKVLSIGLALVLSVFIGFGTVWADTDSDSKPGHDRQGGGQRGFMQARMDGPGHNPGYGGGHNPGYGGGHNPGHGGGYNGGNHRPRTDCESLFHRIKHLRRTIRHWHGHRNERYWIFVNELREAKFQYRSFCGHHGSYRDGIAD